MPWTVVFFTQVQFCRLEKVMKKTGRTMEMMMQMRLMCMCMFSCVLSAVSMKF